MLTTTIGSRLTIILLNTYIHLNRSNFSKTRYRLREDLDPNNIVHGAFWESSFRSGLFVGLYRLRSNEQGLERNNRYTTCFIFTCLVINRMIHRMTLNTPSTINQSFRLDMKHIWLK